MQQINVEQIMEEIRAEIREKGYTADMLSFMDVPLPAEHENTTDGSPAADAVEQMRRTSFIAWRRPVNSGIKGIVKRVLYKLTGFIVAPVTEDQTVFNSSAVSMAEQIWAAFEAQQKELAHQKEMIRNLQKRLSNLEKEMKSLKEKGS